MARKPRFRGRDQYKNSPEDSCAKALRERGLHPTKCGWPDFIVFTNAGSPALVVEVKPGPDRKLKPTQIMVMAALKNAGFKVQRYDPVSGFADFDEQLEIERRGRE